MNTQTHCISCNKIIPVGTRTCPYCDAVQVLSKTGTKNSAKKMEGSNHTAWEDTPPGCSKCVNRNFTAGTIVIIVSVILLVWFLYPYIEHGVNGEALGMVLDLLKPHELFVGGIGILIPAIWTIFLGFMTFVCWDFILKQRENPSSFPYVWLSIPDCLICAYQPFLALSILAKEYSINKQTYYSRETDELESLGNTYTVLLFIEALLVLIRILCILISLNKQNKRIVDIPVFVGLCFVCFAFSGTLRLVWLWGVIIIAMLYMFFFPPFYFIEKAAVTASTANFVKNAHEYDAKRRNAQNQASFNSDVGLSNDDQSENKCVSAVSLEKSETLSGSDNRESEYMFCRKCGMKIPVDSEFCLKCGQRVIK